MADAPSTKDASRPAKEGFLSPFLAPIRLAFSCLFYVSIATAIAIFIEWLGMLFIWPQDHSQTTFMTEIQFLGAHFSTSFAGVSPADLSMQSAMFVKELMTDNALVQYFYGVATNPQSSAFESTVSRFLTNASQYIQAAAFVIMIIAVRLTVIVLSALMLFLAFTVSAVDGLTERELRKYGGDIEHSRVVHLALYWAPRLIAIAPVAYLAWPHIANPVFFFTPALTIYCATNYALFSQYQKRM